MISLTRAENGSLKYAVVNRTTSIKSESNAVLVPKLPTHRIPRAKWEHEYATELHQIMSRFDVFAARLDDGIAKEQMRQHFKEFLYSTFDHTRKLAVTS